MTKELSPTISIYSTSPHGGEVLRHTMPAPWKDRHLAPITVVIAHIPPRIHSLNRALKSIQNQVLQPERIIIQADEQGEGAATTRNKALQKVPSSSEWVAFLDDDDYFGPEHLSTCLAAAEIQRCDYVYPWFTIAGPSIDPFQHLDWYMKPWDDQRPHQTTIVTMVRRELAQAVGFREVVGLLGPDGNAVPKVTEEGYTFGEDYQFTLECLARGAKIVHAPIRTWYWVVTGHNTSGKAEGWMNRVAA